MKTIAPSLKVLVSLALAVGLLVISGIVLPARSAVAHLGYGFNVIDPSASVELSSMNFNWIKLFDVPQSPLPQYVLLRIDVNAQTTQSEVLADLDAKLAYKNNIQAWEIGNEVNTDAPYGWNGTPDLAAYQSLLCAAYNKIKSESPSAIVVSAGLAPVGRNSDAHQIDERVFLQQLLAAGGGACLDVVGFHPYGYSANYDVPPDTGSKADPPTNCDNGLCFRGAEKMYEVMQANGAGDKKMWATEFGWITQPPSECLTDPSWSGRAWQIVSPDKQSSNLVGAFQYADAHWPWMGAMFVFNWNFNQDPHLNSCDQVRFYSVQGQPAASALTSMPKNPATLPGKLKTAPSLLAMQIGVHEEPLMPALSISLSNWGWQTMLYTATVDTGAALVPVIANPTGTLSATAQIPLQMTLPGFSRTLGVYTGTVTVVASPGAFGSPRTVSVQVNVVGQVHRTYLPLIVNQAP